MKEAGPECPQQLCWDQEELFPSPTSHLPSYDIAFKGWFSSVKKEKSSAGFRFFPHTVCKHCRACLLPGCGDGPAETAQSPSGFRRQQAGPNPVFPKEHHGHAWGGRERSGKYLDPEAPSTPLAAPSSILFILQPGGLARESKLPLFLVRPACTCSPLPPLPLKTSLLMGGEATRKSQSERGQSTGLTKQGCRFLKEQTLSVPHLGWAPGPDTRQLPRVFQDHFLEVMQLSTGSDGSVHLVPGTRDEGVGGSRAKETWWEIEGKKGGKENDWPRMRAGLVRGGRDATLRGGNAPAPCPAPSSPPPPSSSPGAPRGESSGPPGAAPWAAAWSSQGQPWQGREGQHNQRTRWPCC